MFSEDFGPSAERTPNTLGVLRFRMSISSVGGAPFWIKGKFLLAIFKQVINVLNTIGARRCEPDAAVARRSAGTLVN